MGPVVVKRDLGALGGGQARLEDAWPAEAPSLGGRARSEKRDNVRSSGSSPVVWIVFLWLRRERLELR